MTLDDLIGMDEAAEISGRSPVTMRAAASRGKLDARRVGDGPRAVWVTTREAVAAYMAYVGSAEWAHQPQRQQRPGGHPPVRHRRRRARRG